MTAPQNPVKHPKALRILCAEDDDFLARMLTIALEKVGHTVERVADGHHAFERIASDPTCCDLLVTDHRMPRTSGLQLLEKVRQTTYAGRVIVHSSQLREEEEAAYRALAVDHIFAKPVQLAELLTVVQQWAT